VTSVTRHKLHTKKELWEVMSDILAHGGFCSVDVDYVFDVHGVLIICMDVHNRIFMSYVQHSGSYCMCLHGVIGFVK